MTIDLPDIAITTDDGTEYELDSMVQSYSIQYGKNQPFASASVKLGRQMFTDLDYWKAHGHETIPVITPGSTKISIEGFGSSYSMIVEKSQSGDKDITMTCYSPAYRLKTTYISSVASFDYTLKGVDFETGSDGFTGGTFSYSNQTVAKMLEGIPFTVMPVDEGTTEKEPVNLADPYNSRTVTVSKKPMRFKIIQRFGDGYVLGFMVDVSVTAVRKDPTSTPTMGLVCTTEYVFGSHRSIFAFLAGTVAGYRMSDMVIDDGYVYDLEANGREWDSTTVTMAEIEAIVGAGADGRKPLPPVLKILKIRPDAYCWAQIEAIGALVNCTPFFYDKAYFVDYNRTASSADAQVSRNLVVDYSYSYLE